MKKQLPGLLFFLTFLLIGKHMISNDMNNFEKDSFQTQDGILEITFIGHGTLMLKFAGKTIQVDPWSQLADYSLLPDPDLVLITHEHGDHLDINALKACRKEKTEVVLTELCSRNVSGGKVMHNGDIEEIKGITVEAVPAYNINHKTPQGRPYHPKGDGNGYVLSFADNSFKVYIAGDTENIPEMAELKDIDIAFLPMNLPYTMTPQMTAEAALSFHPRFLYPYHYGNTDTSLLVDLLKDEKDIEVRIRKLE